MNVDWTELFHPLTCRWFLERFGGPTEPQRAGWAAIARGRSTLIAAPTGSGKTLAAFLWSIDRLIQRAGRGQLDDATSVLYVSPLKALGNDVARNLQDPLAGIYRKADAEGVLVPGLRIAVRSGDTPSHERQAMVRRPPHILITTPESLYILLTAERSRRFLRSVETVILDEIHAVAQDKRGAHLALSVERLEELTGKPLQRIGLSATQKPIEELAKLLVGARRTPEGAPDCTIVDVGHRRAMELGIEVPDQELGPIATHELWAEVYEKVVAQIQARRTTLVFVNTRRLVERVAHQLTERLGENSVGAHHGSLSRARRLEVEEKLKAGELRAVVATASLELGIDIGHVDLVCQIGSPRSLNILLQRVGRSGHWVGALPRGVLYPLTRDDLMECVAALRAVRAGELDRIAVPDAPLDILAQQIVAAVASSTPEKKAAAAEVRGRQHGVAEEQLWQLVRRAYPYRGLERRDFDRVLEMLSDGISTRRGRRGAYVHRDRINGRLRPRRGARMAAILNGGAIPDNADYDVVQFPDEALVGRVNEDFAIESLAGDIFLLGNRSWRIRRVGAGKVWVEDAQGLPPTVPFWLGEAPARTRELSAAVSELRRAIAGRLDDAPRAAAWLAEETGIPPSAAEQLVSYVAATVGHLGTVPSQHEIVAERFFDEAGGMQLVIHSPWGGRINRAWGMALRKRFCLSFDRELQAAATDDGIVISLVEQHSFPVSDVFEMLRAATVERELIQAALASPLFANRWRWNATRALAVARSQGGKKVPVALQRMRAEDLLAAVFPEQVMCQDNRVGPVPLPDHPLVNETMKDCLQEAMDLEGLRNVLRRIETGEIRTVALQTVAPSPMAHEILNANPYAFLDDAPLEERRARAVSLRQIDPALQGGLGRLDPEAVSEVRRQARPDVRDADELHDFLLSACLLPAGEEPDWEDFARELVAQGRATVLSWRAAGESAERRAYVAAERLHVARAALPHAEAAPALSLPRSLGSEACLETEALRRIVAGWLEVTGPVTASELAQRLGVPRANIERALLENEVSGAALRGEFSGAPGGAGEPEWCDRVLLARIHRLTLARLRREIESVAPAEFLKFLLVWQHVAPSSHLRGREGVLEIVRQLQGLELPAPAWEQHVLPARVECYEPAYLEQLCLGGVVCWGRLRPTEAPAADGGTAVRSGRRHRTAPTRSAPIAFVLREEIGFFLDGVVPPWREVVGLSAAAHAVAGYLEQRGASFLADIARGTGLLKSQAESALWELVARGYATGDGIAGLRALLAPEPAGRGKRRRLRLIAGGRSREGLMPVGRWSLWGIRSETEAGQTLERRARQLLRRYGIVLRELLARETGSVSWRELARIYRRMEARGEIRGGRFVNGFTGEQFALPQAVEMLRRERRAPQCREPVIVAAGDPLNLVGILTPGQRISPYSRLMIAYRDGVPIAVGTLGELKHRLQGHRRAAAELKHGV
ncbi:MAG TPA: DEAD/DEAH box helicase [candidate division Zixibacteria bacterium]|nr:DEAD/DEAH box helicase [candidate division Zixibacteria bacterium]